MRQGIAVAGSLIFDQHFLIPSYPKESMLVTIEGISGNIGGSGNLILDLAKMDPNLKVQVSAVIGNESYGEEIKRKLLQYPNIDISPVKQAGATPVTYVMDSKESKQRTFFYNPASSANYTDESIQWDFLAGSAFFQLIYLFALGKADKDDSEFGTGCARILHHAQSLGMKTSFDMVSESSDRCIHGCRAASKYSDYCSINEVEIQNGTGITVIRNGSIDESALKDALLQLKEWGISAWVVCHAAECSYGLDCKTGIFYKHKSLDIDKKLIVGKTGAGDAFCSGILYSAYRGDSLPQALALASGAAGCSLFGMDGTSAMRSYEEILKVYEQYNGGGCETF